MPLTDAPPAEQILANFERLERSFANDRFRGCPFVNAVAELKQPGHAANRIAVAFKDARRAWFRELLVRLDVDDPDGLATQLMLLVTARSPPRSCAAIRRWRAARAAAATLLTAAGVDAADEAGRKRRRRKA